MSSSWLLPAGVEEVLPPEAGELEALRRSILDLFSTWGYELVMPPFLEYLQSLLDGTGPDLDLRTFKVTDQPSGRLLGLRADMTPQVARIDAHRLARGAAPVRLCYAGTVLHARAGRVPGARAPIQIGAEIYGHGGVESDVEAIALMLEMLRRAGVERPHLDVGHLAVFRGLARGAALGEEKRGALFAALQRKAEAEIGDLLEGVPAPWREWLGHLAELNGGPETLDEAARRFGGGPPVPPEVEAALSDLAAVSEGLRRRGEPVHFDLAELRGYRYHGGIGFAAFVPGHGREIARGGRYDGMTTVAGRPRPATGFSADLRTLHRLAGRRSAPRGGVLAPWPEGADADGCERAVRELRAAGERVVYRLPGPSGEAHDLECDRELVRAGDGWTAVPAGGAGRGAAPTVRRAGGNARG